MLTFELQQPSLPDKTDRTSMEMDEYDDGNSVRSEFSDSAPLIANNKPQSAQAAKVTTPSGISFFIVEKDNQTDAELDADIAANGLIKSREQKHTGIFVRYSKRKALAKKLHLTRIIYGERKLFTKPDGTEVWSVPGSPPPGSERPETAQERRQRSLGPGGVLRRLLNPSLPPPGNSYQIPSSGKYKGTKVAGEAKSSQEGSSKESEVGEEA
jgi:hypothetical protein